MKVISDCNPTLEHRYKCMLQSQEVVLGWLPHERWRHQRAPFSPLINWKILPLILYLSFLTSK